MKISLNILLILFAFNLSVSAQKDWSNLSPNQKIKLAKKEQKAAKKDPAYLALMDEALVLFQSGDFEEAREVYNKAHELRPDNVYPLVMLDDIEVAMSMPVEEVIVEEEVIIETETIEELPVEEEIVQELIIEEKVVETPEQEVEIIETEVIEEETVETEIAVPIGSDLITTKEPETVQRSEKVVIEHPVKIYEEDGVYREDFKEGSANIEQITIVNKGASTVYRKVSHSWGAVYYFENGNAIFKTEWEKMLSELEKD